MFTNFSFVMSDTMLRCRNNPGIEYLKPVTKEMVETFIRDIVVVSSQHENFDPSRILFTFEARMALTEIDNAISVTRSIIYNLKEETDTLKKIGGDVRAAICEHEDAVHDYEIELRRLICAKDILKFAEEK